MIKINFKSQLNKVEINRRDMIKSLSIIGLSTQFGFLTACADEVNQIKNKNDIFSFEENQVLEATLNILFPNDGNGPSIDELNSFYHIVFTLNDKYYDYFLKSTIINGLKKLIEYSTTKFNNSFEKLSQIKQESIILEVTKLKWGEKYCSVLLNLIFESIAIDHIYNVNVNGKGWDWLSHQTGQPQPNLNNKYPELYNSKFCANEI